MAQEAASNAIRHSQARELDVEIELDDDLLCLHIRDNGAGFDPTAAASGLGMKTMRQRMEEIDGTLEIQSTPKGTAITARVLTSAAPRRSNPTLSDTGELPALIG